MKSIKRIFLLFTFFIIALSSKATHVFGAEFEWEEVGKDTFVISINVYRDCNGVNLSATPINLRSSCGSMRLNTSRFLVGDVTPVCPSVDSRCKNSSSSFKYGIEQYRLVSTFIATTWRANSCCNVNLSWSQCCRNGAITTGAANQNYYIEAEIDICETSELQWNNPAITMSCLGQDVAMDHSITSTNPSDSIVYTLAPALTSATGQVSWSGSYDYDAPVYFLGFPKTTQKLPRGFHLDKTYGELNFRPMKEEVSLISVKATVYRKGKKIAETARDFQYIVMKCPSNNPPILSGFDLKDPKPENFTRIVCADNKVCFDISATDKNSKDSVKLTFNGNIGDSFNIGNKGALIEKGTFCWTPDTSYIGEKYHSFAITAKDNACPGVGLETKIYKIKVIKESTLEPELSNSPINNCGLFSFKASDKNGLSIDNINWYLNDTTRLSNKDSFSYTFYTKGTHIIKAQIVDCDTFTLYDTLVISGVNELSINLKDTGLCASETLKLDPQVSGNNGNITYSWTIDKSFNYQGKTDTSVVLLDLSKVTGSSFSPIVLTVSDTNDCKLTKEIVVTPKAVNLVNIENSRNICVGDAESIELDQYKGNGNWTGANVLDNEMNLDGLKPGNYLIVFKLEQELGCVYDTALISFNALPNVVIGDNDFTTCVGATSTPLKATPTNGSWTGSGISNGDFSPTMAGKGNHELIYSSTDILGCTNSDTLTVTVFDYEPLVTVTDTVSACQSDNSAELKASVSGGSWIGSGIAGNSNPFRFIPADFGAGSFEVYYNYTDSNNCSTTKTSIIEITEAPLISIKINDTLINKGDTLKIANNTANQSGANFTWSLGNPVFLTSTATNIKEVIDTVGEFDLMLIAADATTGCADTLIQKNAFKVVLGTGVYTQLKDLSVYPNPAGSFIKVDADLEIEKLSIFSLDGRLMQTYNNPSNTNIDVSFLESGWYLLQIESEGNRYPVTFIKE